MRSLTTLTMTLVTMLVSSEAGLAADEKCAAFAGYDAEAEITLVGAVDEYPESPESGQGILYLRLKADGETRVVHLGPRSYADGREFAWSLGERVEVTGVVVPCRGEETIVARRITRDGEVLEFRDEGGRPLWSHRGGLGRAGEQISGAEALQLPNAIGEGDPREVSVLLDEDHLKLATITLRGGTELPPHSAPAPTTIQVLRGRGVVHVEGQALPVSRGNVLSLAAGKEHDVVPAEGSDMLLLVHYLRCASVPTEDE